MGGDLGLTASATVLIPTLNEEADIEGCLESVAEQDVGSDALDVLVIDGGSSDGTVARANAFAETAGFARFDIVHNHARRTAAALALGLREVATPLVVRVDARSRIPTHYIATV